MSGKTKGRARKEQMRGSGELISAQARDGRLLVVYTFFRVLSDEMNSHSTIDTQNAIITTTILNRHTFSLLIRVLISPRREFATGYGMLLISSTSVRAK